MASAPSPENDSVLQVKVSHDRWQEAQAWENQHWINAQRARGRYFKNSIWKVLHSIGLVEKYRGNDWNDWWKKAFNNYDFLPSVIDNAIEVGCGPYTNIRLMQAGRKINHIVLSDPLIRTYIHFKLTFVGDMHRRGACMLDDHPIEELPYRDNYFDLVVINNVLDHVKDAEACMENVIRVLKPGGILILGQDLTNEEDIAAAIEDPEGLIGHPIKLAAEWFNPYLELFDPLLHRLLSREEGRTPEHHYGTLVFAGKKR